MSGPTRVPDDEHVRLDRIVGKLAVARASPVAAEAFGAWAHGFELGAPLPEAVVGGFEERHGVALPRGYRLFVTELGDGGAGPGTGIYRLNASCCAYRRSGHLARPSPYRPGPRRLGDWEQRHEDPPGPDRTFLPGTLEIAGHGCSLATRLIVTGPARGRLINLDHDGPLGPYVVEDAGFLAWYERWLDEAIAGYDVGWFGERLPLGEAELVTVLKEDPSPERRARAGESLLGSPAVGDDCWAALTEAMTADVDPAVRAKMWELLRWPRHQDRHPLAGAETIADDIARYARARTPPALDALALLRRLTLDDVLPELERGDIERRRRAADRLTWCLGQEDSRQDLLEEVTGRLLDDPDALVRSHGVAVADRFGLVRLHPRLRELQDSDPDPWVRHRVHSCLSEQRPGFLSPAAPEWIDEPPF
ncbi:hypothetical protein [Actinomadura sp. 21ATH]|uniref:hypothetical protein n=1 Tax=Actinomadura sp. 21ATH TaxID=1735444 RepID=UPI0035C1ED63